LAACGVQSCHGFAAGAILDLMDDALLVHPGLVHPWCVQRPDAGDDVVPDYDLRYSLRLLSAGVDRLRTMAALRRLRPDLDLHAAKALLDAVPCIVMSDIPLKEKERARQAFLWTAEVEFVADWTAGSETLPGGP
jgi:hypothetical protein